MSVIRTRQTFLGAGGAINGGRIVQDFKAVTTTATPKTVAQVRLAAGESVLVRAFVLGNKSDATAAAGNSLWGVFRRQSGGNVTLVGALQGTTQTNGVTPAITLAANTTDQTVDLNVTGIAAETWEWQAEFEHQKV